MSKFFNFPKCGRIPELAFDIPKGGFMAGTMPGETVSQVTPWITEMFRLGLAFNMDDPACDIEHIVTGDKLFTPDEAKHMAKIITDIPQAVFDFIQESWVELVQSEWLTRQAQNIPKKPDERPLRWSLRSHGTSPR